MQPFVLHTRYAFASFAATTSHTHASHLSGIVQGVDNGTDTGPLKVIAGASVGSDTCTSCIGSSV